MSQTALSQSIETTGGSSTAPGPAPSAPFPETLDVTEFEGRADFDYRPVPIAAPVTLFLGFCSFLGFFTMIGLGIGLFGTLLGLICLYRIRQAKGDLGGEWIALVGTVLAVVCLVGGASWHSFNIATEVPEGFERINFSRDISKKGFAPVNGQIAIHPDVAALDGKEVFIKGYMYPEKRTKGLKEFLLVKDSDKCCFGGQPNLNDMIMVTMEGDVTVDHLSGLVSVAGVFHTAPTKGPAGEALYSLRASHFERSRSNY